MFSNLLARTVLSASLLVPALSAHAAVINFTDWAFNIDGVVSEAYLGNAMPGDGFLDPSTGLGSLSFELSGAGNHSWIGFLDLDFDAHLNTYLNEYGLAHGAVASGQSWQIDEPGYAFGTIYDNVIAGALDNTNHLPSDRPDDVSLALGWNFDLAQGETALITLTLSDMLATSGFYLEHVDPQTGPGFDDAASVYFWSSLEIFGADVPVTVPEPGSLVLMALGLIAVSTRRLRYTPA
ncbi:PEP-CTERM sorting domain-containing protein [Marinobacter sediminicola]|uniref:PEP-CTERM sorting domain-containing protein n=1 Tax=Marinobacter sediminicola TaxID=3072994 RepID=UPI0028111EE4|nr:PEP-CTERM sorting domain-containing protein [Marinobacter sp. F26243]